MTEPTRADIISRGAQAKALKDNDVLKEAFDSVLSSLWDGFMNTNNTDECTLSLHRQVVGVLKVRDRMKTFIHDAAVEETNQKLDDEARHGREGYNNNNI